jgi:predicted regulator of Ras-like GTPase activity (Roadblock/LC7/MglB family)
MVKKKNEAQKTTTVMANGSASLGPAEEDQQYARLCARLDEARKFVGVKGYILKDASSAVVNLADSANLVEFAKFSSEIFDSFDELSEIFALGKAENILVQGKTAKILCIAIGKNRISILMEKEADDANILSVFASEKQFLADHVQLKAIADTSAEQ